MNVKVTTAPPRCPTCFRRLRPLTYADAWECPARRCPLGYRISSLELLNRAIRRLSTRSLLRLADRFAPYTDQTIVVTT